VSLLLGRLRLLADQVYACPIVEALGFDLKGGDLMFIAVAE